MIFLKRHPLIVFLIVHFLVWSIIPLLRSSLPMDSIEAIIWGQLCDWGTNKHPPLSGHMVYQFYVLGGHSQYAVYALSQLCVLIGFVYIYKLAQCFMGKECAVFSVMVLEGVIYYGFSSLEFNVNVVSLALWPATVYYFYRALCGGNLKYWALTGIFSGLNLVNKYVSGILLLAMLLFMLFDKEARGKFKTFGPYVAGIMCLVIIFPHLCWLYQYDFFVLDYFLSRGGKAGFENLPFLRHIVYPLKFIGAQILFGIGAALIYFGALAGGKRETRRISDFDFKFIVFHGIVPLILMFIISFAGGIKLKSMWGFPVLFMLGIMLFVFFPHQLETKEKRRMFIGTYLMMTIMAAAQICVIVFNKSDKLHLDVNGYGWQMERLWLQKTDGKPFKYVAGDVWWVDNVALFAPAKPKPVIWGDVRKNPWINAADFAASGALVITAGLDEYAKISNVLTDVSEPSAFEIELKNLAGKTKRKTIYYGFYNL